jgi:hypothetical protein
MSILAAERPAEFAAGFNRSSFRFEHTLHRDSIFDLPNLVELAKRVPDTYYTTDAGRIDTGWDTSGRRPTTLLETMASIERTQSLVLLKGLAEDGEFGPVFRDVLGEVRERVGDALGDDVSIARATLIIGSPGRITPYHIDAEANFLFQLRGEKIVNVFDPADRTLLTDRELEAFFSGDLNAARYRAERQADATVFDFAPGNGVHLPILAPHWTRNGDSVSVAISVNCSLRSGARLGALYRFNHLLRERGLPVSAPGINPSIDRCKMFAMRGMAFAKRVANRAR